MTDITKTPKWEHRRPWSRWIRCSQCNIPRIWFTLSKKGRCRICRAK